MPSGSADVLRWLGSLDALAAFVALALGFFLVGLVLVVAFPLVFLASSGWITLSRQSKLYRARWLPIRYCHASAAN
jgi:hypothetical protein